MSSAREPSRKMFVGFIILVQDVAGVRRSQRLGNLTVIAIASANGSCRSRFKAFERFAFEERRDEEDPPGRLLDGDQRTIPGCRTLAALSIRLRKRGKSSADAREASSAFTTTGVSRTASCARYTVVQVPRPISP
jgi:hypothetical protein